MTFEGPLEQKLLPLQAYYECTGPRWLDRSVDRAPISSPDLGTRFVEHSIGIAEVRGLNSIQA